MNNSERQRAVKCGHAGIMDHSERLRAKNTSWSCVQHAAVCIRETDALEPLPPPPRGPPYTDKCLAAASSLNTRKRLTRQTLVLTTAVYLANGEALISTFLGLNDADDQQKKKNMKNKIRNSV